MKIGKYQEINFEESGETFVHVFNLPKLDQIMTDLHMELMADIKSRNPKKTEKNLQELVKKAFVRDSMKLMVRVYNNSVVADRITGYEVDKGDDLIECIPLMHKIQSVAPIVKSRFKAASGSKN